MSLARVEQKGRTLIIMNNNPSKRGALSLELYDVINEALERAKDPAIRAVIFASEGGFFCSGGDLNALQSRAGSTLEERREKIQDLHDITAGIRGCPVPVIAAVEGGAAGAGLSLALACDMIIAAPNAKFTASYVKAGVVPDGGLTSAV
jgi:2-(1,2-epoxy-1,2-dihydrophenyl)acetyl-CoA isomerase